MTGDGEYVINVISDGRRLSVRLSVPCLTLSREWKGGSQWVTPLTRDPFSGRKIKD